VPAEWFLPEKAQRILLRAKIKPGSIIHLFCNFINPPHNKFVVVTHIDHHEDELLVFFINSAISPFMAKDPNLVACQISLTKIRYPFLDHDSFLNCSKVIDSIDIDTIIDHLLKTPKDLKGVLLKEESSKVVQAVSIAQTISEYDRELIIKSIGV
jgi:hypothetical protein